MVGKTILHYKIIEKLGSGGMGIVYKAEDTKLKRLVALKFLPFDLTRDDENKKRFMQEAQAASAIQHNNICVIHEINETSDGQIFICMDYYEGETVKKKIEDGALKLEEALNLSIQIAEGLAKAHAQGITHRDIKPANIIIINDGVAKILDFGLAKLAGESRLTKMGMTMGTAAYMSPEQTRGEEVDDRTDIWSLGVVFYEMLTNQLPFKGDYEEAVIYSILHEEPLRISELRPEIPESVVQITDRLLAKTADDRYQHIDEARSDLQSVENERKHGPALRNKKPVSFFKDLIQRRVPQILLLYFGASFGIIKIVQRLVQHYEFSPYLSDLTFVTLVSLIPTICLLAYFHGKRGDGRWTGIEKLGIPLNLVVSAALLIIIFQDKDLGAITKTVTLKDEEGRIIERVIPKGEFRKKIALFFFENESSDSTFDWLRYGIPFMVEYDLSQDIYFDAKEGYDFYDKMKEAGFVEGVGLPLTLKLKIADRLHLNHLLSGSFTKQENEFVIKTSLYETKRGRLVAQNTFEGEDIFNLADKISLQLKRDLNMPTAHIEEVKDLPVSEIVTKSVPAFKAYVKGLNEFVFKNDHESAAQYLEQSVQTDPLFTLAHLYLFVVYANSNQTTQAEAPLQKCMQYIYKLPENYQFSVKAMYYLVNGEQDKRLALLKMWSELYPDDIDAHSNLAQAYRNLNQIDEAVSEYKQILRIDEEQYKYLHTIGDLLIRKEKFEGAEKYYREYAKQFPDNPLSFSKIGELYETQGDYEKAKTNFQKALLLEPSDTSMMLEVGDIDSKLGKFNEANAQYQAALKICKTAEQRSSVYNALKNYYESRGQINKSIEYLELRWKEKERFTEPLNLGIDKVFRLDKYIQAGKKEVAFKTLQTTELYPPFDKWKAFGYLLIYMALEDADNIKQTLPEAEKTIQALGIENVRAILYAAEGILHELQGEHEQAIQKYKKSLGIRPGKHRVEISIGECYRMLKQYAKAKESLQEVIKMLPFDPQAHYEIAVVYYETGEKEKALEHLKIALFVWQDADAEYQPAIIAKEKLVEWGS